MGIERSFPIILIGLHNQSEVGYENLPFRLAYLGAQRQGTRVAFAWFSYLDFY